MKLNSMNYATVLLEDVLYVLIFLILMFCFQFQVGGLASYWVSNTDVATKNISSEFGQGKSNVVCISFHPFLFLKPHHRNILTNKLFTSQFLVNCLVIENVDRGIKGRSKLSLLGMDMVTYCWL